MRRTAGSLESVPPSHYITFCTVRHSEEEKRTRPTLEGPLPITDEFHNGHMELYCRQRFGRFWTKCMLYEVTRTTRTHRGQSGD